MKQNKTIQTLTKRLERPWIICTELMREERQTIGVVLMQSKRRLNIQTRLVYPQQR